MGPIIVVRANSPGNKARKGGEVPVPADLMESLRDLASFHTKDRYQPMLCTLGTSIPELSRTNTAPAKGETSWPSLELL